MKSDPKSIGARPGFRVLAGIISVLIFTTGLPMSVMVALHDDPSMWLIAFPSLLVGVGFATVAVTGHWLCFKRTHNESGS